MTIGECLAGALYWKSFVDLAKEIGFSGPYLVTSRNMSCGNEELAKVLGTYIYIYIYIMHMIRFNKGLLDHIL